MTNKQLQSRPDTSAHLFDNCAIIAGYIEPGLPEFRLPSLTTVHHNQTLSVTQTMTELSSQAPVILIIIVLSNAAAKVFGKLTWGHKVCLYC